MTVMPVSKFSLAWRTLWQTAAQQTAERARMSRVERKLRTCSWMSTQRSGSNIASVSDVRSETTTNCSYSTVGVRK